MGRYVPHPRVQVKLSDLIPEENLYGLTRAEYCRAYRQGVEHCRLHDDAWVGSNPYDRDDREFLAWEDGFLDTAERPLFKWAIPLMGYERACQYKAGDQRPADWVQAWEADYWASRGSANKPARRRRTIDTLQPAG